jgi:hypothetical protein
MKPRSQLNSTHGNWAVLLGVFSFLVVLSFVAVPSASAGETIYGDRVSLGDGHVQTYIQYNEDGSPSAIGIEFTESMLTNLPHGSGAHSCWDKNKDDHIDIDGGECIPGHERVLFMPKHAKNIPFSWVLLEWNSGGHPPPGIYDVPHFDFHFYIMDYLKRNRIRMGPCAPEMIDCDDLKKALVPLPSQFLPKDYVSFGEDVAVPRMGMHLLDPNSPELLEPPKKKDFTHNLIFGTYDGHITFVEPMVALAFLQSKPDICSPINQPAEYEHRGYYPTKYCIRFNSKSSQYTVALEDLMQH